MCLTRCSKGQSIFNIGRLYQNLIYLSKVRLIEEIITSIETVPYLFMHMCMCVCARCSLCLCVDECERMYVHILDFVGRFQQYFSCLRWVYDCENEKVGVWLWMKALASECQWICKETGANCRAYIYCNRSGVKYVGVSQLSQSDHKQMFFHLLHRV